MKVVLKKILPNILYFFVFLCIWQALVTLFGIKEFIVPSPLTVLERIFNPAIAARYNWPIHLQRTIMEVVLSFLFTAVLGIGFAILITWSKVLSQILMPIFIMFNSLPKVAFAPMFLLWFGYGLVPNILIAFLVAFFPVVINSSTGLAAVEEDLLDLVRYLNASKLQIFIKIRIPNSLPYIFAGLKISATMCVVGAIVGEFIATDRGLGYLLRDAQAFIDTPTMFACLMLLSATGFLFFSIIQLAEKLCMPWNHRKAER